MTFQPIGGRVLIKEEKEQNKTTASGLFVPETKDVEYGFGKVISISNSRNNSGEEIPPRVHIGDSVLFPKFSGSIVKIENEEFTLIDEEEIWGILE